MGTPSGMCWIARSHCSCERGRAARNTSSSLSHNAVSRARSSYMCYPSFASRLRRAAAVVCDTTTRMMASRNTAEATTFASAGTPRAAAV